MRLTFEGNTMRDILDQIEDTLKISVSMSEKPKATAIPATDEVSTLQGPGPVLEIIPETVTLTQPGTQGHSLNVPVDNPVEKPVAAKPKKAPPTRIAAKPKPVLSPAELAALQKKTVEELQAAYANGKQTEVFALLAEHGNGAKSFRELPMDAFVPIREAIDNGALN